MVTGILLCSRQTAGEKGLRCPGGLHQVPQHFTSEHLRCLHCRTICLHCLCAKFASASLQSSLVMAEHDAVPAEHCLLALPVLLMAYYSEKQLISLPAMQRDDCGEWTVPLCVLALQDQQRQIQCMKHSSVSVSASVLLWSLPALLGVSPTVPEKHQLLFCNRVWSDCDHQ